MMRKTLLATLIVVGSACAAYAADAQAIGQHVGAFTSSVIEFVKENERWAVPVVSALAFGESLAFVSLILPATVILVAITGLLGAAQFGTEMAFSLWLAGAVSAALGYSISYWIGYYFKDSIGEWWPFRTNPRMLESGNAFFRKWGVFAVFLGHFFGPVRAVIPVVAGSFGVSQVHFQIANVLSSSLWALGILVLPLYGVSFLAH